MTELRSGSSRRSGADPDVQRHRQLVWLVAAAAALGAVAAGAEPTASPLVDVAVNSAVAVTVVYLSSRADRWAWLILAAAAILAARSPVALVAAGVALVVASTAVVVDRRDRVPGALVGALAVQVLFRLPDWEPNGLATLVAFAAVLPVLVSGFRNSSRVVRRRMIFGVVAVIGLASAVTVVAIVVVVGERSALQDGVDAARDGLAAAESGETAEAGVLLGQAEQSLRGAASALGAAWMAPTAGVPIVGQNLEALSVAADQGAQLAATAREALFEADVDSLQFQAGALDLDRVRAVGPPLERSSAAMEAGVVELEAASSPWLLPPLSTRYADVSQDLADAAADADVAADVVAVAPGLFGGDGDRRYVVLFTTPAELRGLGGLIGQYGELTAVDGDVQLTRSGPIAQLIPTFGAPPYALSGPADYLERWERYQPDFYVQDTTASPDFPSVAQVWEQLYPQMPGGGPIDGVIVVDPYALAALMTFTGPITVPGHDVALTADNAANILLREQYLSYAVDNDERIDFLDDVTRLTFEALTTGDLPGPRQVIDALGPVVGQGRLLVYGVHPDEQDLFVEVGMDGALPPVDGDFLSVITQNSGNNKIDIFLHRTIRYDVVYDPETGRVQGEVTVTLRNDAPASGLPRYVIGNRDPSRFPNGTNVMYLSVYTPWEMTAATLDGVPLPAPRAEELGRFAYEAFVEIPPGGSRTLTFAVDGAVDPDDGYLLTFAPQPLVNPDQLTVDLAGADGWRVCDTDGLEREGDHATLGLRPQEDLTVTADFCGE